MPKIAKKVKEAGPNDTIRIQFEINKGVFDKLESAFNSKGVEGNRAMFVAGAVLFKRLAEEPDYVKIRLFEGGGFEIERVAKEIAPQPLMR